MRFTDGRLLAMSSTVQREREGSSSSYKDPNPILGAGLSWPHLTLVYLPKALAAHTIALGIGASTFEFGGHRHAVHSVSPLAPITSKSTSRQMTLCPSLPISLVPDLQHMCVVTLLL